MGKKIITSLLLILVITLLVIAVKNNRERKSLNPAVPGVTRISEFDFTTAATVDGLMLKSDELYDANSLMPASKTVGDCPT